MKYFTLDSSGNITGAYIQDLLPEHEAAHLEVSDEDYAKRFTHQYVNGAFVLKPPVQKSAAEVIAEANALIKSQIATIEARQSRAVRESLLGVDGAAARLQALEDEISTLRGQLQ